MNKLKMIKTLFFVLMFLIVFALSFIIRIAFINKDAKPFEVTIEAMADKIGNFEISGNYEYMTVANKIRIVDIKWCLQRGNFG